MDFSTDAVNVTFPADEGGLLSLQFDVDISIVDDQIDEADREYFILHLSLIDGDSSLLSITLNPVSVGTISDNDGGFINL